MAHKGSTLRWMIRTLATAAALAAAALGAAPTAGADPQHYTGDVPGMTYDVSMDQACFSWERFTYGRGPGGEALTCRFIPNQNPARDTGVWVISYPLYGVQQIGARCPGPQSAAQSPDGLPLLCLGGQGWQPGLFIGGAGPYSQPGVIPSE